MRRIVTAISVFWLAVLGQVWLLAGPAASETVGPLPAAGLDRALAAAAPGDVLLLQGGDYDVLSLRDLDFPPGRPVTLRSADPADRARFGKLFVHMSRGLVIEGVDFTYVFAPEDPSWFRPFQVADSRDIRLVGNRFFGDVAHGLGPVDDGFPTGIGFAIRGSERVEAQSNLIVGFGVGLVVSESSAITVRGNELTGMRRDGMNFSEVQQVLIEANHVHDFNRSLTSDDHPDMIQFWTTNARSPTRDITIRGNLLSSGQGGWSQSVFMRNEMVDTGAAGEEMFYRNITIENNFILNAHTHGITVGEVEGLRIVNNTLLHNPLSDGPQDNPPLWRPQIRITPVARDVEIARNVTAAISGPAGQSDWRVADNLLVQDLSRLQPGFIGTVFAPEALREPWRPSAWIPLAGGPLDGTGIGAPVPRHD